MNPNNIFFVKQNFGHCGDNVCCLSAAIKFAEIMDAVIYVNFFKDVVEAYYNPRLLFGTMGTLLNVEAPHKHRNKHPGLFVNILGTYYSEFGLPIDDPVLQLPQFEKTESRAVIQPFSNFALNPPLEYVQDIVNEFVRLTGRTLYVIGHTNTPRTLKNVDYSLLQDSVPVMMRHVQNASCVLSPRSFASNLAAGYRIPAYVWSPQDGEDWHLNYRGFNAIRFNFGVYPDSSLFNMRRFVLENKL